jgi:hypothetical protein
MIVPPMFYHFRGMLGKGRFGREQEANVLDPGAPAGAPRSAQRWSLGTSSAIL